MNSIRNIVLDTNYLIQCVSRKSVYYQVWSDFLDGRYNLCVSTEILSEYEEIIGRLMSPEIAKIVIEMILRSPYTLRIDAHFRFRLIEKDPDDNKFVDCAIAANAEYIVSNDAHFDILKNIPFPSLCVVRIEKFLEILNEER